MKASLRNKHLEYADAHISSRSALGERFEVILCEIRIRAVLVNIKV